MKDKKKKQINHYEFTQNSPEACICEPNRPFDEKVNRMLTEEEKELTFLTDHIDKLNSHALRVMADLSWNLSGNRMGEKISRVPQTDRMFGKKWFMVRYVGSFGVKVKNIFHIQEEDQDILSIGKPYQDIIPGKSYVVPSIEPDSCPDCLSENVRFKIKPESKVLRCGVCLGLEGLKGSK